MTLLPLSTIPTSTVPILKYFKSFPMISGASRWPACGRTNHTDHWPSSYSGITISTKLYFVTVFFFRRLNHYLGQGQSWPFHGTNMILHGCATFFLGCICWRTLQLQNLTYLMATLLFALHPIHTEAVRSMRSCWHENITYPLHFQVSGLVGCADLLACNLTLLSFMAYSKYYYYITFMVAFVISSFFTLGIL